MIAVAYLPRRVDYCAGAPDCPICAQLQELFERWDREGK